VVRLPSARSNLDLDIAQILKDSKPLELVLAIYALGKKVFLRKKEKFQKNVIVREPRKERADVLLVYPIWVTKAGRGSLQRMLPPLGILSIASFLEAQNYEVHIVDLHAEELSPEQFRQIVQKLQPRFVGITVLSTHFTPAHFVAKICKDEIPDVKVYVGGVHAEAEPEQMLRSPWIDAVVRGDGEAPMLELVQQKPYEEILGLSYRNAAGIRHNPLRQLEKDLDKFPLPAYHLIDFDNYFPPVGSYKDLPALNVLMTRGCPGQCTFCNSANTVLRYRSVDKMIELISMLRYRYGIRQIYFYDDTFTANARTVEEFCHKMIAQKVDVRWICYVRADMFRESLAELMAKAGCHQVLIGVESGSDTIMKEIGKPIQKEKHYKMVKIAHKYGIEVRGSFIIGHLNETPTTLQETLDFAVKMDLDLFQCSVLTPYPGTQIFRQMKAANMLVHESYSLYGQNELVFKHPNLTYEEIQKFEKRIFFRFYMRPRIIVRQLFRLTRWNHVKDVVKTFYVLFIQGVSKDTGRNKLLNSWLEFDLGFLERSTIQPPKVPRLTYEVRQVEFEA